MKNASFLRKKEITKKNIYTSNSTSQSSSEFLENFKELKS
jgi:hypothetical protein